MKVLHVVASNQRRGAEVFTADLVPHLTGLGVDQHVAVMRAEGAVPAIFQAPVSVLAVTGRQVHIGPAVAAPLALRRLIRSLRPDVVQAHGGEAFRCSLAATIGQAAAPVVYRRIGSAPEHILHGARRLAHAALMRKAAHVVAVADAVRSETITVFGVPPGQVTTIPNAVEPARVRATRRGTQVREALGVPPGALVVLSLGSLSWEKDPQCALRVTAGIRRGLRGAWHLFAGDGPLRGAVEASAPDRGPDTRVRILGSRADVGDILEASDILLLCSHPRGMEGMPACVIEAGLAGLPVVAYAVAGVPEVVIDSATGVLAAPGDEPGLAEGLARVAQDPQLRQQLGAAAAERCQERFAMDRIAPEYLSTYEQVLSGPRKHLR